MTLIFLSYNDFNFPIKFEKKKKKKKRNYIHQMQIWLTSRLKQSTYLCRETAVEKPGQQVFSDSHPMDT